MRAVSVLKARVRMAGSLSIWIFTVFVVGPIDSLEASMRPRVTFSQGESIDKYILPMLLFYSVDNSKVLRSVFF